MDNSIPPTESDDSRTSGWSVLDSQRQESVPAGGASAGTRGASAAAQEASAAAQEASADAQEASTAAQPASAPAVRLDPDAEFTTIEVGGVSIVRCVHHGTGQHFQFGTTEHHVAMLLDGQRTVTEIVEVANQDGLEWTPQDVADFIGVLVSQKLAIVADPKSDESHSLDQIDESPIDEAPVDGAPVDEALVDETQADASVDGSPVIARQNLASVESPASSPLGSRPTEGTTPEGTTPAGTPAGPSSPSAKSAIFGGVLKAASLLISIRLPLLNADPLARHVLPYVNRVLHGRGLIVTSTLIAITLFAAAMNVARLSSELMRVFDSHLWIGMLVIWAVMKSIHEIGHACFARHHGVRVGRGGIMFFMFAPLAYVDVTDAWKLRNRFARVAIALGGVYFELICASVAFWLWWSFPGTFAAHLAAQVFFLAGPATLLVNANPLLRLDGYYVVSDLTEIPNLRQQGRELVGGAINRRLFSISPQPSSLTDWRRSFAAVHAIASVIFQVVWMGGLVIVVAGWAGPLGQLIAAAAIALWVLLPTGKWLANIWNYESANPDFAVGSHRRRVLWVLLTMMTLGQFVFSLPAPVVRSIPVVTRFADEQVLRAPVSGFVGMVHWNSGQRVRTGEIIMEIEKPELFSRRDELRLEIESESIQWQRYHQTGQLGLAEAASKRSESLKRELMEVQAQVDALRIMATRDGEILTPELQRMQGRFVDVGSALVRLGKRDGKEILVSVADDEIDDYQDAVEKRRPVQVGFRGGQVIDVIPTAILPRGSKTVLHPALAASAGGPLPVAPAMDASANPGDVEFLDTRFHAIVELPPSVSSLVRCGEVGQLGIRDHRSMARRLWIWLGGE